MSELPSKEKLCQLFDDAFFLGRWQDRRSKAASLAGDAVGLIFASLLAEAPPEERRQLRRLLVSVFGEPPFWTKAPIRHAIEDADTERRHRNDPA